MDPCLFALLEFDKCLKKYPQQREKCDWLYHYLKDSHKLYL